MNPPQIYYEWVQLLRMLRDRSNDETVIPLLQQGELVWQDGVAQRFVDKLLDLIDYRLDLATNRFQDIIDHGDNNALLSAISGFRTEFKRLTEIVDIPAIPGDNRDKLKQMIKSNADAVQDSLEKSAESDPTGKVKSLLMNNPVNV